MKNLIFCTIITFCTYSVNAQWQEPSPVSYNSENVYALASDGTNIFAGTGGAGISLSTNNGASWTAVNTGLTSTGIGALAISGKTIFAGGDSVYISTDNGTLWTAVGNGLPKTTVNALAVNGTTLYAGTQNNGVYISTNNGTLWSAANTGFTGQVQALAISGTSIFLGAPNHGVYVSTNNGGKWTAVNSGLTNIDVHSIAMSGSSIYAGTSGGVFVSTNNGANWTVVNNGLTNLNVYVVLTNGSDIYVGTDDGVFYSNNNGSYWTANNDGFPAKTAVQALAINGSTLFAGIRLEPYGVWTRQLSEIKTGFIENHMNSSCTIFPNPASHVITLTIDNSVNADLIFNIYSITGTLVKSTLLKQNNRQISIDDLNNGIYLVEIRSKGWIEKQMLIIQR